MKKLILHSLLVFISISFFPSLVKCQFVSKEEAALVAQNWIQMVIDKYGSWGGNEIALEVQTDDLNYKNRTIGYYCRVQPTGFIIVSLRKEFSPIKAYSEEETCLDFVQPNDQDNLIASLMYRMIDTIETRFGSINYVTANEIEEMVYQDFRPQWEFISNYQKGFLTANSVPSDDENGIYEEGEILMETVWDQISPYNFLCPFYNCQDPDQYGFALVGCFGTAMAQIMRHWCWPPNGVGGSYSDAYDWANMPNGVYTHDSDSLQEAVAELSFEAAHAADTDFGCEGSSSNINNARDAFREIFIYNENSDIIWREWHDSSAWYTMIKDEINKNRPLLYRVENHAIVADGWREMIPGDKEYHMNYGWNNQCTAWYNLDELYFGGLFQEKIVRYNYPGVAMGPEFQETFYSRQIFPYRYFDRTIAGIDVTFEGGQYLQVLNGVRLMGIGTDTYLRFYGNDPDYTRIFSNGDATRGIRIGDGAVGLKNYGIILIKEKNAY